jgi:plastocyanin
VTHSKRGIAALLAAAVLAAACGSSSGSQAPAPSAPPGGAVVTAKDIAFDRTDLHVPAGTPFTLLFENREGAPHNVRIYDDNPDSAVFVGEIFSGLASRAYQVPAIAAGQHKFRCDVHPQMAGTVTAG